MYTVLKNSLFAQSVHICYNIRTLCKSLLTLQISVLFYLSLCINVGTISSGHAIPLSGHVSSAHNITIRNYNSLSTVYDPSLNSSNNHLTVSVALTTSTTIKPYSISNDTIPMMLVSQVTPVSTQAKPKTKPRDRLLKCHCDICKDNNNICETDGYCFTSVQKETSGALIFSYSNNS